MPLRLITPPAEEPVTLAEAKAHLRVTHDAEDGLIELYLASARETVEDATQRALMPQVWELGLSRFPPPRTGVELPVAPLLEVLAIEYFTFDGSPMTLSPVAYAVSLSSGPRCMPSKVFAAAAFSWPAARSRDAEAVRIRFRAGYADAASVPAPLKAATLLLLGELYDNREAVIPTRGATPQALSENPAVRRLIAPFIIGAQ